MIMHKTEHIDHGRHGHDLLGRMSRFILDKVVEPIRRECRRRATERELLELDNRTLKDIGCHRCEIGRGIYRLLDVDVVADRPPGPRADGAKADRAGIVSRCAVPVAVAVILISSGAPIWAAGLSG